MTRDFWGAPFDGARHPDVGTHRDMTDAPDEREGFDAEFEAEYARKRAAMREDDQ